MRDHELKIINTAQWIEENKASFLPPVCNKLMHNEQLVIMFVGGPNQREDYHIEDGEELFYQIKGDMCVKILENGHHKDIHIRQGEVFILPARIPHSPQRTADSVGLVIERRRQADEIDGVRWLVPHTPNPLYEKWFHCKDLGTELIPLIKAFFASDEYKTKVPGGNVVEASQLPYELNKTLIQPTQHGAFNLQERIAHGEKTRVDLTPDELNLQFRVEILKRGEFDFDTDGESESSLDTWLWQLEGASSLTMKRADAKSVELSLSKFDSVLVPAKFAQRLSIRIDADGCSLLKVTQNPNLATK